MRPTICCFAVLLLLGATVPAFGDDQQKAEKEIKKITAMATDFTGRGIVSRTMSDLLNVKRPQFVQERSDMGLNYGSLFLAHELVNGGAKMSDIAAQLRAGKDILQVANDQHANWKQINGDAKKLNGKIDENIYKHYVRDKADQERDLADRYDPKFDGVKADADVTPQEIAEAEERFTTWHDRASKDMGHDNGLNETDRNAGYIDHVKNGGPQGDPAGHGNGSPGIAPPAAGGIPQ